MIAEKIYKAMEQQGMTTYKLAQLIGMKYELLLIMKYVDVEP